MMEDDPMDDYFDDDAMKLINDALQSVGLAPIARLKKGPIRARVTVSIPLPALSQNRVGLKED